MALALTAVATRRWKVLVLAFMILSLWLVAALVPRSEVGETGSAESLTFSAAAFQRCFHGSRFLPKKVSESRRLVAPSK